MGSASPLTSGWAKRLWFGLFHSVSAFNNAGFALFSDNLMGTAAISRSTSSSPRSSSAAASASSCWPSCSPRARGRRRLSVHTQLVLGHAVLLVGGTVGHPRARVGQPADARPAGVGEKVLAAYFQAVTPAHRGLQHHRHRRHDGAGAVPDHRADVHRRVAGRHGRRRQDDDVRRHGRGDLGDGARRERHRASSSAAWRRTSSPAPSRVAIAFLASTSWPGSCS